MKYISRVDLSVCIDAVTGIDPATFHVFGTHLNTLALNIHFTPNMYDTRYENHRVINNPAGSGWKQVTAT